MSRLRQQPRLVDWAALRKSATQVDPWSVEGRLTEVIGSRVEAVGIPGSVGDRCHVQTEHGECAFELTGMTERTQTLSPLDDVTGLTPGARVRWTGRPNTPPLSTALLGRVLDGLGRPLDRRPAPIHGPCRPLHSTPPPALERTRIDQPLATGVRGIDLLHPLGRGQRVGIFAGSGVGKSTLLGMALRHSQADVNVLALVGERGREVRHFLEDHLGSEGLARTVVVASTSDRPAAQRLVAVQLATAIAEWFRDQGRDVLFVMDSATRYAMALRDVGLAAGEPPAQRGYPPSLTSELPRWLERLGTAARGSITALLTVLVEGDDLDDPVADCLRGLLDGHLVLSRTLAERGHYPPVDPLRSLSRVAQDVSAPAHRQAALAARRAWARREEVRDLLDVGAVRRGQDRQLDAALDLAGALESLLQQDVQDSVDPAVAIRQLQQLTRRASK